jgi:hypothetical protein
MTIRPKIAAILAVPAACLGLVCGTQADIKDGLVLHLPFDTDYADASGHGLDGIPMGAVSLETGILNKAVSLTTRAAEGIFNYVSLGAGTPPLLDFGSVAGGNAVDFSIAFWCNYTTQVSDPCFIACQNWDSSNNQGWGIYMQGGGNMRIVVTDEFGSAHKMSTTTKPVVRDGTWHHVLVTFNRTGNVTIYVDGNAYSSKSMAALTGVIDPGIAINIGQDNTGVYDADMTDVRMDDLGIWRRALSAGEAAAIYNAGKTGKDLEHVPAIPNPFVASTTPANGAAGVAPNDTISAVITDGLTRLDNTKVQMTVNGTAVTPTISKVGANSTVSYVPSPLLPSDTTAVSLIFANDATPAAYFTNNWTFKSTYVTVTPAEKVTPDTSKPGFIWRIFANNSAAANDNEHTEQALTGLLVDADGNPVPNLADPAAQGVASGPSTAPNPANAAISFTIPTVINLSVAGGEANGTFVPDDQMPGVPSTDFSTGGLSAEVTTYLDLPAGLTIMGVASDDGFRTTVGSPPDVFSVKTAGEFNGGRGVAETRFMIVAQEAGTYAFRTTYENGGGELPGNAANLEWYTVNADSTKVLINDVAHGGLRASRAVTTPVAPYVKYVNPASVPRQLHVPASALQIILADGTVAVNANSPTLKLDGKAVTATSVDQGATVKVTYAPTTLMIPDEEHSAELTYKDTTGASYTKSWTFRNLKTLLLPAPALTENFDSYAEGSVPTGWNAWNFTTTDQAGEDLDNLHSDSYKGWIVVTRDRLQALKGRIFNVAPGQTFNGVPVTVDDLSTGSLLYAETDVRSGSQVQFITSKPFDLAKVTNVVMTVASLYEQNQDDIASIEYSVDGGQSWLPLVYYLDFADSGGDIVLNPDGTVDAVTTLTQPNTDTAYWTDGGVAKGGKYGDAIGAPITQALAPYIAPRQNDNPVPDKRIEVFRLPKAGLKSDVRLRFAQIGTASWYFGVDNLAFYEGPAPAVVTPAQLTAALVTGGVSISWTGTGTLQEATVVTGPWAASANQSNPQTVPTAGGTQKFFKVVSP